MSFSWNLAKNWSFKYRLYTTPDIFLSSNLLLWILANFFQEVKKNICEGILLKAQKTDLREGLSAPSGNCETMIQAQFLQ